ncbi:hypothetical protein KJA17_00150 [Patescibacteria group bacterium]|nr:hypothetical protein [Patescibacteria group bacterium]
MRKVLIIFILIVFAGIGIAGFWYWQKNQYSKEILKLEILGPEVAQAGDEVEYLVRFKNNGKVRLENPELIFEVPEHSILQDSSNRRITKKLEDIYPGQEQIFGFKVRVFGKENETLMAKAWLSYQPKNLKARYESKTSNTCQIKFVPLTFEFDLPLKIEKDEKIEFSLNYFSNIDYLLEDLRVKIEYPESFEFLSASPQPLDETEWEIPPLSQADGGRIEIKGKVTGEEGTQKIFRAKLGLIKDGDFWLLKETARALEIIEPSLYISQLINDSPNYIAEAGDFLHYEIFFRNIGQKAIEKKFLFVELEGEFFDLLSLKSEKGEYGRGDNTIIWDWKVVPELRFLDAGEEGKVEFWVGLKEAGEISVKTKTPSLRDIITLGGVKRSFELKINSQVKLAQKVYFQQEFWENSGPLPPEVDKTTTYTVLWQVENSWNDLKNVKVKSTLPKNVRPTGKILPEDAKFTFDSKSKEVLWNIGDVEAWLKEAEGPLTLAFQIEFTPDSSQKGETPNLVGEAEVLGEDAWTLEILQEKASPVDTTLPDDGTVTEEQGIVQ